MCEYSGRLIAWLDHELPGEEAANVERHVGQCAECRHAMREYEEVSAAFLMCYEAAITVEGRRKTPLWVLGGIAAAAVLVAILLAQPRAQSLALVPQSPRPPAFALQIVETPRRIVAVRRRRRPAPIQSQWIAVEPTIEVALPADALFPPGAVPLGFSFIADVRP
jgi:hypothetical protein